MEQISFPLNPGWTPLAAFLRLLDRKNPFFLDGCGDPQNLGRYSFAGADPFLVFTAKDNSVTLEYPREGRVEKSEAHPFDVLRDLLNKYVVVDPDAPPLSKGGAVGYFAYDLFKGLEDITPVAVDDVNVPDVYLAFYDTVLAFDHKEGKEALYTPAIPGSGPRPAGLLNLWDGEPLKEPDTPPPPLKEADIKGNQTREAVEAAVSKVREHIAAGDVYQVNLSQRFTVDYTEPPMDFYLRLRKYSPAPFGACLFPEGFSVLSNSPERYLLIHGDYIETRPIKGTRPRGLDQAEDEALAKELYDSVKDGAEHVMIVDLERNDLGRVCSYDSVHVPEFKVIESYANVHHMVSTVAGRVHPSRDIVDCIKNSFPGGSITGAPKVRSMELIDRLEPTARGVYCGSIGYIDFSGRVDLNIAIRTATIKDGKMHFQVGGGIVYDSDPAEEFEETITKAQSVIKALTGKGRLWEK